MPLSSSQQAAHDKAWAAADYYIEGRFRKGDIVEGNGGVWRITTYGIAYHEDIRSRMYGVQSARPPKGWAETQRLRAIISEIVANGVQEPGSRGAYDKGVTVSPRPEGKVITVWQDARRDSMARFPSLTLYEDGVIGVVIPGYGEVPVEAWTKSVRLAAEVRKLVVVAPTPVNLARVTVKPRRIRIYEDKTSHFADYAAAPGAILSGPGGRKSVELPAASYREVRAMLAPTAPEKVMPPVIDVGV